MTIIGVCLLIGAMAKSSQVGLHVWLPMAIFFIKVVNGQRTVTTLNSYGKVRP